MSVDSRNSHIAWLRTIREKIEYRGMKDIKVEFPIIDDVSMKVANLYGMIQPGESQTAAVRAVFFVDPEGKLRAMIYYPLALGRNFEEIKRVLVGLQSIDAFGVAMPADWRPGDEVIVPAYTYIATAMSVVAVGAMPVIAEVNETLTLDPEDTERKITDRTRAILPVHIQGFPCDMETLCGIAKKHGLFVLEAVAQAHLTDGDFRG